MFDRRHGNRAPLSHIGWRRPTNQKHLHRPKTGLCDIIILRLIKLLKQHKTGAEFLHCCNASWDFEFGWVRLDFPFE